MNSGVPIAWKPRAFDFSDIYRDVRPHGQSIAELVASIPNLPVRFWTVGEVCVNGDIVPRHLWPCVRPKATSPAIPIMVTMHLPLGGGGGGGAGGGGSTGKGLSIVGIVAALALTVVTAGISSGLLFAATSNALAVSLGTALGVTVSAAAGQTLLAGAVGLAGALAISALTAPPAVTPTASKGSSPTEEAKEAAAAQGNVIEPGGPIPRVLGTRKAFPALACEPVTELVGDNEVVEALYILNGPHLMTNIKVGDGDISDAQDVTYVTGAGWPSDPVQQFILRQGRTTTPQLELSTHSTDTESPQLLSNQAKPDICLPVWHTIASRNEPDEVWLHLLLPQGLSLAGSTSNDVAIPFRLQLRQRGTSVWKNLPEFHVSDRTQTQLRKAIILKFGATPPASIPTVASRSAFVSAFYNVPDQTANPVFGGWTADASFYTGSGNTYLFRGVESTSGVKNVFLYDNRIEIYLDATAFPSDTYDIRIKRGSTYDMSHANWVNYTYNTLGVSFFDWYYAPDSSLRIPMARENLAEQVYLVRVVSIWNEQPLPRPGFAYIALKARNRRLEAISTLASGYVRDWDGSGWNNYVTTSNPAPHYVDVLTGALNLDPLPPDLMDSAGLVAWRTLCASNTWKADIIIDDSRTQDALQLLASCGYARPYQSEVYGVTIDKDRSGDTPMQVFSPRNLSGFRFERAFVKIPDGFRVTYKDINDDYNDTETIVYRADYSGGDDGLLETINYEGIVDLAKVRSRAKFDLDQAQQRSTFYYFDADAETILCRRGDLVAVQHDTISRRQGGGYVKTKIVSGGNITGLRLDQSVPVANEVNMHAITDMHLILDMHAVGRQAGVAIRRTDGTISTHVLANPTTEATTELKLATPIADVATIEGFDLTGGESGCLVVAGDVGVEYRRLLVSAIAANTDLLFSLTLVDEAPALVRG